MGWVVVVVTGRWSPAGPKRAALIWPCRSSWSCGYRLQSGW